LVSLFPPKGVSHPRVFLNSRLRTTAQEALNCKCNIHPTTLCEGTKGITDITPLFLWPWRWMLGWGSLRRLTSGQTRNPLYRRLSALRGQSRGIGKLSPPPGFEHQTAQPVENGYTDYSIHYRDSSFVKYKLAYQQASLDAYILCLTM